MEYQEKMSIHQLYDQLDYAMVDRNFLDLFKRDIHILKIEFAFILHKLLR